MLFTSKMCEHKLSFASKLDDPTCLCKLKSLKIALSLVGVEVKKAPPTKPRETVTANEQVILFTHFGCEARLVFTHKYFGFKAKTYVVMIKTIRY